MKKWILTNGLRLIYVKKPTSSVALQVLVNVGSNWENPRYRGISHFIEHMVFEGTDKRSNAKEIANEIERVGGEINAYTSNERTCFYAKVLGKHFDTALDVMADILQRPLLREEDVERQKNILFKEIDLVTDEPRFHQWVLFQQTMFRKHPSRYPTYGTRASVRRVTGHDLHKFFQKYYLPKNMTLAIVGNVPGVRKKVERAFSKKKGKILPQRMVTEPAQRGTRVKKEKRNVANTYVVLGHRTVPRWHKDSYVLDVIDAILGRGQSGWMFDEIRNRHGLAYEVGTQHVTEKDYGFFATHLSANKKDVRKVKRLILDQLKRLERLTPDELHEAKTYLEGDFFLSHEDTQKLADEIVFWEQMGNAKWLNDYVKKIKSVSLKDVRRVAKAYLRKNYCLAIIEGK